MALNTRLAVARSLLTKYFPCPPEINEIIVEILQWLYERIHTRYDLKGLPNDGITYTFMLNMKIHAGTLYPKLWFYEGNVDVTRTNDTFTIEFVDAKYIHTLVQCNLWNNVTLVYTTITVDLIDLLPYTSD